MKKGVLLGLAGFFLLFFLFSSAIVSAAASKDVGYILVSKRNANKQITDVFSSLNLTYDLIEDSKINSVYKAGNLSKYKFLFIDDVRLRNTAKLPIYNYPSVIMNSFYGYEWGLTNRNGINQLTYTSPLNVKLANDELEQVYNLAWYPNSHMAIPYYHLLDLNKAPNMQSVARTYTGDGSIGDVISYANEGTVLTGGRTSKGKICFFGIAKTKYWTDDAKNLFLDCIGYAGVTCRDDSECPNQPEGNTYCHNDDVYQSMTQLHCENAGTIHSACVDGAAPELKEDCDDNNANTEDSCVQTANNATCLHTPVKCFDNIDCGIDGFVENLFCTDNKTLSQNFITFTCNNPGQINSFCSNLTKTMLNETCSDTCLDGKCRTIKCYEDLDCDDDNLWTEDKCENPGTILSECTNNPIKCFNNLDCGADTLSGASCSGLIVVKNFLNFTCNNAGQSTSFCTNISGNYNIQTCSKQCQLGKCTDINCTKDDDCDDGNAKTVDQCAFAGTPSSFCRNTEVNCMSDIDCGFTGFSGSEYCFQDDTFKNFQASVCSNPGTLNSSCTINIGSQFLQDCGSDSCGNFSNYCKNDDVYKIRTCFDKGCSQGSCFNNVNYDDVFVSHCDHGCSNGMCNQPVINCTQTSDCGQGTTTPIFFCKGDEKWVNSSSVMCFNANTTSSYCGMNPSSNFVENCGNDSYSGYGNNYCVGDDVYRNRTFYDRGCLIDSCFDNPSVQVENVENCSHGCSQGDCISGIHDVALINFSHAVNNIFLDYANGTTISSQILTCRDVIKAKVTIKNQGNFTENVTMSGNIDGNPFSLNNILNFVAGDSTTRSSLTPYLNLTGLSGFYNITINAFIPIDNNLLNNIAKRQIEVICPSCFSNSDCGTGAFLTYFCKGNEKWSNFGAVNCFNPGAGNAYCGMTNQTSFVENCGNDSYSGYGNNYCIGDDVYRNRTFYDRGCLIDSCFDNSIVQVENVENCSAGCSNGECITTCHNDSECGTDKWVGFPFCSGGFPNYTTSQNLLSFTCVNPGQTNSYCTNSTTPFILGTCIAGCSGEGWCTC